MNERLVHSVSNSESSVAPIIVPLDAARADAGSVESEMQRLRRRLRELAGELVVACEAARAHLARELHDGVGAELTAARFALANMACAMDATGRPGADSFAIAQRSLDAACQASRLLMAGLHAPQLDSGVVGALSQWTHAFSERTGLRTSFVCAADVRLTQLQPNTILAIFRVAQEALANVAKHAQASSANVRIEADAHHFTLVVSDDGCGMPRRRCAAGSPATTGFGLAGMRARCEAFGGTLRVITRRARTGAARDAGEAPERPSGTTVRARFAWAALLDTPAAAARSGQARTH